MTNDRSGWDDEEQTIVSYSQPLATPPCAPAPAPPAGSGAATEAAPDEDATIVEGQTPVPRAAEDPDATVIEGPPAPPAEDSEDRTIVVNAGGRAAPTGVEDIAWLVLTKTRSVRRGVTFKLDRLRIDIGSGIVDVSVNDRKVSRSHAAIKYEAAADGFAFVLHDLASTNGTFVNGSRIASPVMLKDGDRVGVGDTELVFKMV